MFQVRAAWELMEGGVTASGERPQVRLKPSAGCVCVCAGHTHQLSHEVCQVDCWGEAI